MATFFLFEQRKEQFEHGREILFHIGGDDAFDVGFAAGLHFFEQFIIRRQHKYRLCTAILELMLQFTLGVERVGGDDDATRFQDAVIGHDELWAVGHVDDGAVAYLEAGGAQSGGDIDGPFVERAVGYFFAAINNGCGVGVFTRRFFEKML